MVGDKMRFVVQEINEKEKKKKMEEEILNLILGRKYKDSIKHFQHAE
jgi:hypothetical protein